MSAVQLETSAPIRHAKLRDTAQRLGTTNPDYQVRCRVFDHRGEQVASYTTCFIGVGAALFLLGLVLPLVPLSFERDASAGTSDLSPLPDHPSIDVIIPAYLEGSIVAQKVEQCRRALDACEVTGRVIVVASGDETVAAARLADEVIVVPPAGKPLAINRGVAASDADICVVSDANCLVEPVTWPKLIGRSLGTAGLVSGQKTEAGGAEHAFWRLERLYKRRSQSRGSLSVAGEFMAFRRGSFREIPLNSWCDDLWLSIDFHLRGLPVVVDTEVLTTEAAPERRDQWFRRTRMSEGLMRELFPRVGVLARSGAGRELMAHKLYRQTFGCFGFWTAAVGLASLMPLALQSGAFVCLVGSIAAYRGAVREPAIVRPFVTLLGLQMVPVVAATSIVAKWASGTVHTPGWRKVPR